MLSLSTMVGDAMASINAGEIERLDAELMDAYRHAYQHVRWFNPARPHLSWHIRRHLNELEDAYITLDQLPLEAQFKEWVHQRVVALPAFAKLFDPIPTQGRIAFRAVSLGTTVATSLLVALPIIGIPVTTVTISAVAIAFLKQFVYACFCWLFAITWLAIAAALWVVLSIGFGRKRRFLIGARAGPISAQDDGRSTGSNIYELEQTILLELDKPRHGEVQLDVVYLFSLSAMFVAIYGSAMILESYHVRHFASWLGIYCFAFAALFLLIGVLSAISSAHRPWAWRPTV
jgi:hypothetical protein